MVLRNFVEPNISEMKPSWIYGTDNLGPGRYANLKERHFKEILECFLLISVVTILTYVRLLEHLMEARQYFKIVYYWILISERITLSAVFPRREPDTCV